MASWATSVAASAQVEHLVLGEGGEIPAGLLGQGRSRHVEQLVRPEAGEPVGDRRTLRDR